MEYITNIYYYYRNILSDTKKYVPFKSVFYEFFILILYTGKCQKKIGMNGFSRTLETP